MEADAPAPPTSLACGDEVCLIDMRTGRPVDISVVEHVGPDGSVFVRGWRSQFSQDGTEVRAVLMVRGASPPVCEVRGLDGRLIALLPRGRARSSRAWSARWVIRHADVADRDTVSQHDEACALAARLARRLNRAARGRAPLPAAALVEAARLLGVAPG